MASRDKNQLTFGPGQVHSSEQEASLLQKVEQPSSRVTSSGQTSQALQISEQPEPVLQISEHEPTDDTRLASTLFDAAAKECGLSTPVIAQLCGVSDGLVYKWRSVNQRECPSFVQMLRLPASFHIALHRGLNKRYGFGRAALSRLLDAAGELALVVNE